MTLLGSCFVILNEKHYASWRLTNLSRAIVVSKRGAVATEGLSGICWGCQESESWRRGLASSSLMESSMDCS